MASATITFIEGTVLAWRRARATPYKVASVGQVAYVAMSNTDVRNFDAITKASDVALRLDLPVPATFKARPVCPQPGTFWR